MLFDVVVGRTTGIIAAGITAIILAVLWIVLPISNRPTRRAGR
jgi:hypothetical protein